MDRGGSAARRSERRTSIVGCSMPRGDSCRSATCPLARPSVSPRQPLIPLTVPESPRTAEMASAADELFDFMRDRLDGLAAEVTVGVDVDAAIAQQTSGVMSRCTRSR